MTLRDLTAVRVFVQVVDSHGLASAGRVLGMPANTVSRTLSRLESDLGVRLLLRTTRTLSLTEEGRAFHASALLLLASAAQAEATVKGRSRALTGTVRMAVRTTTVQFDLVPALGELLTRHPALRVQLFVTDDDIDLVSAGLDLALRVGAQPDSTYASKHIGDVTFVLAATPAYLDLRGRPRSPLDLGGHDCVRALGKRPQTSFRLVGPRKKRMDAPVRGAFECNDVRAQAAAVYAGLGIGLRPLGEVRRAVREGTLERVLPDWTLEPLAVRVLQPSRAPGAARARAVQEVITLLSQVVARMS